MSIMLPRTFLLFLFFSFCLSANSQTNTVSWIRINQFGYIPEGIKMAVYAAKEDEKAKTFDLIDSSNSKRCSLRSKAFLLNLNLSKVKF